MITRDLTRAAFVDRFGGVFEHSPWVAESAFDAGLDATCETANGLHGLMAHAMMAGDDVKKLALIMAHPDLAGRLARLCVHVVDRELGLARRERRGVGRGGQRPQ